MDENINSSQNVIIDSRKKLNVSGVKDVLSFDEETIIIDSFLGKMTIKGENLHIESFNTQNNELNAVGKIHAVVYMSDEKQGGGFVSRLFR